LVTLLLISSTAVSAADLPRDPHKFFFDESFWDMKEELEIAKEKGKKRHHDHVHDDGVSFLSSYENDGS
jgi:hypothetical protein